jgi:hypothetical protein
LVNFSLTSIMQGNMAFEYFATHTPHFFITHQAACLPFSLTKTYAEPYWVDAIHTASSKQSKARN